MMRVPFVSAVVLSSVIGAIVLGIGGRIAMRVYALRELQDPYFTAGGTMTVVVVAGFAGAAIGCRLWLANWLFPERRLLRQLFFWTGLVLLSLRVLNPVSQARLEVFSPLVALHGMALLLLARRRAHDDMDPPTHQSIV